MNKVLTAEDFFTFKEYTDGSVNYEDIIEKMKAFAAYKNQSESNVSSQEPSIEDFRDQVLKVICENRDAIIRASNDRMTSVEVFETKNCFAAVINTYDDLFEIITVLKPNSDKSEQEPDATASKEIGEPLENNPLQSKLSEALETIESQEEAIGKLLSRIKQLEKNAW